jgi:hypothetical protein
MYGPRNEENEGRRTKNGRRLHASTKSNAATAGRSAVYYMMKTANLTT